MSDLWQVVSLRTLSEGGLSQEELASRFSRNQSWVSRRLGLASELPLSVQEQVREGRISSHAAMKYLLPMARAIAADGEALATVAAKEKLTSREVGLIYAAWRDGSAAYRRRLMREPLLFLKTRREMVREPVSASPVRDLMRDLEVAAAVVMDHVSGGQGPVRNVGVVARPLARTGHVHTPLLPAGRSLGVGSTRWDPWAIRAFALSHEAATALDVGSSLFLGPWPFGIGGSSESRTTCTSTPAGLS